MLKFDSFSQLFSTCEIKLVLLCILISCMPSAMNINVICHVKPLQNA